MNIQGKFGPQYSAVQQIDVHTDTRDILAHARRNALKRGLQDWFVCDIDAHHVETVSSKIPSSATTRCDFRPSGSAHLPMA